jgi:predicted alpha/beta hydrolase
MPTFNFKDKYPVQADIHAPNPASDQATTLVFLTAIGVPLRKYSKFFKGLTETGYTVIAADYPCCGDNTPQVDRSVDYNYQDIVDGFIPKLLQLSEHKNTYLLGHSLGGHMATIYSVLHDVPVKVRASTSTSRAMIMPLTNLRKILPNCVPTRP